jgi:hypothetical protein
LAGRRNAGAAKCALRWSFRIAYLWEGLDLVREGARSSGSRTSKSSIATRRSLAKGGGGSRYSYASGDAWSRAG